MQISTMRNICNSRFIGSNMIFNKWILVLLMIILTLTSAVRVEAQVVKNIPGDYLNLADAISDVNTSGVASGGTTLNLLAGNPQVAPLGGYSITATGTLANPLIITGNGNTITAAGSQTAGNLNDAIFKIIGADYVTLQGFVMQENVANTTITAASNNMTEWGVALLYASATNGAQNVTIQNNTISLNRTYQNTFGIYSNSTHTATVVTTSVTATTTAGGNTNLKAYTNNISNVNFGIVVVGPTAAADFNDRVDIGGTAAGQGNIITNFGTTATFSSYANVSATVNGILVRNTNNYNVSYNSIASSNGGTTVGTLRGIYIPSFSVAPVGTPAQTINNNNLSLRSGLVAGAILGIVIEATTSTVTTVLNINNNDFNTFGHTVAAASGAITGISNLAPCLATNINGNTFTNINVNTTGSFSFITNTVTRPASSICNVNNNSIVTGFNKTGGGGTINIYTSNGSTPPTSTESNSGNNFSNITFTGATTYSGWISQDGTTTAPFGTNRTVVNNTFTNITGGSSGITLLTVGYSNANSTSNNVSGNTISNVTGSGTITGITTPSGVQNFFNNTISGFTSTGASVVTGMASTASAAGIIENFYKNKIYNLEANNASGTVNGILFSSAQTGNIYNNIIGDLRAPTANAANPVIGINLTATTGTINAIFNTVYLNATSSGAVFGSSAISANTGISLTLGNNLFVNNSTPNGSTGFTVAYRRSSTTLTSYQSVSNNNILYAGTAGINNFIYYDGTNSDQTIAAFKTRVSPRDVTTFSENPNFISTVGSNVNFLHINPAIPTFMESGGTAVAGITDDFDGQTRNVSTPDIGADEFAGTGIALVKINSVSINPPGNLCVAAARTVTANITVGDNATTSITLNYSFNGAAPVSVVMTGGTNTPNTTSAWTATIPVGIPADASVSWSVTAVDPLVSKVSTGTPYRDEPLTGSSVSVTASSNPACAGGPAILTANVIGSGANITVGAGATTVNSYQGAFYSNWSNKHEQIMVKASELLAAGLHAGLITALSFPTTVGTLPSIDFTIKMAQTNATDMSAFITTGLSQVYFAASQPQVANTNNKINLSSGFSWNGSSNIVIDICFGNSASSVTLGSTAPADNTAYISVIKTNTNSAIASSISCPDLTSNLLTYSVRPKIIFTGVGPSSLPNYVWNNGASNIGITNPLTVYPLSNTSYTVTATDANGCSINSGTPYALAIQAGPTPPGANNSTQCGSGIPGAFVTSNGGGAGFKWYDAQIGGNLLQASGAAFTSTISATTHFWVSESNGTCESLRTEVIATVAPADPIQAASDNLNICLNTILHLTATNIAATPANIYTYSWTASPQAGSGLPVSATIGSAITVTPTATGTYIYTVSASDVPAGCNTSSTVTVTVKALPQIVSVSANPLAVCPGNPVVLSATTNDTQAGTATIGSGATTTATYPAAFYSLWSNKHEQIMIKAAELSASGLLAGNITSLSFPTTAGTLSPLDFSIKLASSNATDMSAFVTTGLTQVYFAATQAQVANTNNTLTFATPFYWNGTSNLIIDICFGNSASSTTMSCTSLADNTSYVSVIKTHTSSATAASITCPDLLTNLLTYSVRPLILVGGTKAVPGFVPLTWSWSNGAGSAATVTVNPTVSNTYTVTATNPVTACSVSANVSVTVYPIPPAPSTNNSDHCGTAIPSASVSSNSGAGSPVFEWYSAPTGGVLLQSGTSTTYLGSVSETTNFYVLEISANGCRGTRALLTVSVIEPDEIMASASVISACPNTPITLTATQAGSTNSYIYTWTASPVSGSGIPNSETGSPVTITPTSAGTYVYTVSAVDPDKGCTTLSTVSVTTHTLPLITSAVATPVTICSGTNAVLSAHSIPSSAGSATVGAGATTTATYNAAFYSLWSNKHEQIMIKASELNSAGLVTGNITSLSFPTTSGTLSSLDFSVKLAQTNATDMSTFVATGLTQVYFAATQTQVANTNNTLTLPAPYFWNGTSNLVIDICFGNAASSTTMSSTSPADNTSYVSVIKTHTSSATGAATACPDLVSNLLTYSVRPKIIIAGQLGADQTATYTWSWNPGAHAGSTVTVNPTVTTIYTATATDVNGCTNTSAPVTVTVLDLPVAPVAHASTQCGFGIPTASVTTGGANGSFKWYSAQTGGTLLQTGGSTYTTAIGITTSFWVSESNATCESLRSQVIVTVTQPDAVTASVNNNLICLGSTVQLSVAQTGSSNTYSYSWSALPVAGSGIPTTIAGTPANVTPTVAGTYNYTVTAFDSNAGNPGQGSCTVVSTVSVVVNPKPIISAVTATPSTVCAGSSVLLEAKSLIGDPLTIKVGTGTTGFTGAGNPYWRLNSADGSKFQFLYKASDLTTLGLTAGPINGLVWKVITTPVTAASYYNNYTISMGQTVAATLTTTWQPGMQLVKNPFNHIPVTGDNTYNFDYPFVWDGTSNIVVQVCYDNDVNNTCSTCTGSSLSVEYTGSVGYNASAYYYEENTSNPNRDMCGSTAAASVQTGLVNITFLRGFANNTSLYTWQWNPGAIPGAITTVHPLINTTYSVTATDANGCVNVSSPVAVTVNPVPVAPTATNSIQCGLAVPTASVSGSGGTFNWYSAATGGTLLQSSTSATYTNAINSSTTFYVAESNGNCESARTAVTVTVTTADPVTASVDDNLICPNQTIQLTAVNSAASPINNYTYSWTASPTAGSGIPTNISGSPVAVTPSALGTYIYTVLATDAALGCVTTATVTVTANPVPIISSAIATPAAICLGGNANLTALSIISTAGTATVGAGATTSTNYNAPFYSAWSNKHEQIMIKSNELTASGLVAGNLTSISFPTTAGTLLPLDFSVKLAQTAATDMSAFLTSGFTQVYFAASQAQVANTNNTLTFSSPYNWDGISNIVIDICFGNAGTTTTLSSTSASDNTAYISVIKTHTSAATSAAIACPNLVANLLTYTIRPKILFGGQVGTNLTSSYNWVWNPGTLNGNTVSVTPGATTTYSVVATNPTTGCSSAVSTVTVTIAPASAHATATPSIPVCAGTSVTLNGNATGGAPFTYSWTDGTAIVYPGTASINVTPVLTTTYTVTVTDNCGSSTSSSVTVIVNPLPAASIAETSPISICSPAIQVLTAVTNATSATYQWTLNGVNIPAATNATYTIHTVSTGTYRVIVTNTVTACVSTASSPVVVTINARPSAVIVTPPIATVCDGVSTSLGASGGTIAALGNATIGAGAITLVGSGDPGYGNPYNYWYGNQKSQYIYRQSELAAAGILPGNINSLSFENTAIGAGYSMIGFTISIAHTTQSVAALTPVTTGFTQVYTSASQPVTTGINNYNFSAPFVWNGTDNIVVSVCWGNSNNGINASTATIKADVAPFVSTTILYQDLAAAAGICGFTTATNNKIVSNRPKIVFGYNAILPSVFTWSPSTGLNTSAGATVTATPTSTTTYTATATSAAGCTNSSTATVTVNPRPTGVLTGGATYCTGQGSTATLLNIAVTGAGPWTGTLSGGTTFSGSTSPITVSVTPAATTTYTIATLNGSTCSAIAADLSGSATITVNPTPATPTVTAGGATTFCSGGSVILTSSSATGNQWNLNGSAVPGATNQTLTVTATGNYSVTVTNGSNCSATSTITAITVNPTPATPTVTAGGPTTFCSGGSVILTSSSATGNQWNLNGSAVPGATNQTLTVTASGNYSVTVTNGSNCSATSTITAVTVNPAAANPTATVTQPTCAVATGTITVTAPLGAGTTYSLDNGPFQSSVTFSGVAAGTHILSVQTSSGCFSPANTTVTVDAQPITPIAPTVTGTVNVCPYLGTSEQITYTATAAGATTYTWTLPPNVNLISGGTGTDHVTVTFNTGFSTQPNKQIRVTAGSTCGTSAMTIYYLLTQFPVTPNPISGPTNVCALIGTATVVSYTTNRSSGAISYAWSVPSNTTVTHPNGSGINDTTINVVFNTGFTGGAITVTAVNGCGTSGTRTTTIVNTPASVPGLISGPTNVCANIAPTGTAATYSVTAVAFATSYTWTTPANTTVTHPNGSGASDYTITVLYPAGFTSGTITVTATNGCGTSAARSLTVTKLNPATPGNIDVIQTHFCGENGGRVFTYSVATMPANATSVQWTVPTAGGALLVSGQGTTSITVSYPDSAITGTVTAQAVNNCGVSSTKTAGVRLPACPPPSFTGVNNAANSSGQTKNTTATATSQSLEVKIFPNPTVSDFKLEVLTSAKAQIHVRILDGTGRLYKTFTVQPYEVIALGAELKTGAYLVEVRQGETVKTTKVIKF